MNTPIEISSLTEYIELIDKLTDLGTSYLFRGQENAAWQVNSSAYRRLKIQTDVDIGSLEIQTDIDMGSLEIQTDAETGLLGDLFTGYLKQIIDEIQLRYPSTYKELSPLECMAHLQHNKVATGLIDFTFSPLVALWFACDNQKNTKGKVFILEKDNSKIIEITTPERLQQGLDVFFDMDQAQWYLWSPTLDSHAVDTQRMMMQQSVFLFGLPEVDTEMIVREIIVPQEHKEGLRTALAKLAILEKTLFADLLGFFERNTHAHPYDLSLAKPYYGEMTSDEGHTA
ncbi:hypothetical protein C6501_09875 [Candidatus Poribacteria bacterium]|nr:MAG: hypothetical protein C6501_09875 [Candidatus Poribacteria bacterium]